MMPEPPDAAIPTDRDQADVEQFAARIAAIERTLFAAKRPELHLLRQLREDILAARARTRNPSLLAALDGQLDVLRALLGIALERETAESGIFALRLAALTMLLVVAGVVTGWYGMNLALPAFARDAGALWALGLIAAACTATFVWLRRQRWL